MTTTVASVQAVFSADTTNLMAGLRKADGAISSLGSNLQSIGGNISAFGSSLGAVALPAAAALGGATFAAMNFNEAITNANSILQLSQGEIQAVSDEILAMGTNAIAGPQAVAESYYDIVSGVTDATTHMAILDTAIGVSEAGASNLQGTTAALVGTMNAYGFAAEDAAYAGDVFTRITGMGVGSLDEFGAALPTVTGLAASLGIGFDELGGQMAFITTKGYSAGQAATMLQASMTALINPNETMIKVFEELGVANGEALINMYGLDGALEAVAGTSVAAEKGLAKTLGSTEALNGALVLTQDGAQQFFDAFSGGSIALHNAMADVAMVTEDVTMGWNDFEGKTNPAFLAAMTTELEYVNEGMESYTEQARRVQRASPAAQFKLMKSQVAALAIEVGTALMPAMVELFDAVKPVLTSIIEWAKENPGLVATIGMIVGGAAALAMILIPLGAVIGAVGGAFAALGAVVTFIGLPIAALVVALGLLALAYQTNFLGIQDALRPAVEWLGNAIGGVVGWIGDLVSAFQSGGLAGAAAFIGEQLSALADSIINADWGAVWANIKTKAGELWENFKTGLDIAEGFIISNIVTPLVVAIASTDWGAVWAQMTQMAGMLWENFKTGLVVAADFILVNVVNPLATQASQFVSSGGLYDAVYNIGLGVWNGLLAGLVAFGGATVWVFENIIKPLAEQAAQYISGGQLWEDVKAVGTGLWDALKAGVEAYIAIDSFIQDNLVAPVLQSLADSDWSGILSSLLAKGSEMVTAILDGISGSIGSIGEAIRTGLNDAIPDYVGIRVKIANPLGGNIVDETVGVTLPNPFMGGTPWTGNMPRNQVAGVVHGQEAVIPTHGMMAKVVPSSGGLMVQMSGQSGGSSGGGGFNIYGDIYIEGVQDTSSLLDKLTLEARRRGTYLGAA